MCAKKGFKEFGERAEITISDYRQLDKGPNGKHVVQGVMSNEMTSQERKSMLEAVNLIKAK